MTTNRDMDELRNEMVPAGEGLQRVAVSQNTVGVEEQRAIAQVQAAMTIAKRFPRDPQEAFVRIQKTCQIGAVAEDAEYSFPRGGKTVRGPSIRLAEVIAGAWGNIDYGVVELSRGDAESVAMTYAWDLETNTRSFRQFVVPHRRDTSEGGKDLSSDRDIYEHIANQGSRRVRACLLQVIPGYVIDAAVEKSRETIAKGLSNIPMAERAASMVKAFAEFGVTEAQIVKWLKHPVAEMIEKEFIDLRSVYKTIKDGMGRAEDYFEKATVADSIGAKKAAATGAKPAAAAPAGERQPAGAGGSGVDGSGDPVPGQDRAADAGANAGRGVGRGDAGAAQGPAVDGQGAVQGAAAREEPAGHPDRRDDGQGAAAVAQETVDADDLVLAAQKAQTVDQVNSLTSSLRALVDGGHISAEDNKRVKQACSKRVKELIAAAAPKQQSME